MIKTCARCGHEFGAHHNAKYCSDECRREVKNENRRRRYHENIEVNRAEAKRRYRDRYVKKSPRIKPCETCGQPFEAKTNAKHCPTCRKIKNREAVDRYRAANPEKVKASRRRWVEQNRAHYNEQQRQWRQAHRREVPAREVTDQHERQREYRRHYYETHREEILAAQRQRYEQERLRKQRQQTLAKFLKWREQHANNRTVG